MLLSTRPKFHLRTVPAEPRIGEPLSIIVTIECESDINADAINLELVATERRNDQLTDKLFGKKLLATHFTASKSYPWDVLRKGAEKFTLQCTLPETAPMSFESERVVIDWRLHIHVSVDWDVDVRESLPIVVKPKPTSEGRARPQYFAFAAKHKRPLIECSIESCALGPNEPFDVRFAVSQLESHNILQVDLQLISVERGSILHPTIIHELKLWCLRRGRVADGETVAHELRVPAELPPSFEAGATKLEHRFVLKVLPEEGEPWVHEIPCKILPRSEPPPRQRELEPVGQERVQRVWKQIALEAKKRDAFGSRINAEVEHGRFAIGETVVTIEQRPHKTLGEATAIALRYPSLRLSLAVAVRPFTTDERAPASVDEAFWQRFGVDARERAQLADSLSLELQQTLCGLDDAKMDDENLCFWCAAGSMSLSAIPGLFATIDALAAQLARFEERTRPPAQLAHVAEANRAFALQNSARLRAGDLSVEGWSVQGLSVSISYSFEREAPVSTCIQIDDVELTEAQEQQLAKRFSGAISTLDAKLTLEIAKVRSAVELEPVAIAFVQAVIDLRQKERGAYR